LKNNQTNNHGEEIMLKEQTQSKTVEERFLVRPPQMSDLDDVLELLEICDLTTIGEIEASAEMLKTDWTNPKASLEHNLRVVTTQKGRIVAYAELWDTHDPLVHTWYWARVHPDFEGQGIGTYLINWAEKVSRSVISRAPEEARFTMQAGMHSTYQPSADLFKDNGMKLKRHFYTMKMALNEQPDAPQLPDNIIMRPMRDLEELPAIVHAIEDAFRDHWGYVDNSYEAELAFWSHVVETDPSFDRELWFLAVDGDQIAGMSLCWPKYGSDEKMGWVGTLGVRRPWRRQGLGLALLKHSFGDLYQRGKNKVGLGVDAGSLTGATRLYERAGMHAARQFDVYEKELRPGIDMMKRTIDE
jgi:GNAT superfamily N-acetyltransferase